MQTNINIRSRERQLTLKSCKITEQRFQQTRNCHAICAKEKGVDLVDFCLTLSQHPIKHHISHSNVCLNVSENCILELLFPSLQLLPTEKGKPIAILQSNLVYRIRFTCFCFIRTLVWVDVYAVRMLNNPIREFWRCYQPCYSFSG